MGPETSILFLNNYTGAGLGGGEVHMRSLVLAVRDAGAHVVVACEPDTDVATEFAALGVEVRPVTYSIANPFASARRARSIAEESRASIIHSNGWLTNLVARLARVEGGPRIVNSILVDPDAPRLSGASRAEQVLRNRFDRWSLGRADAIVPITHAVARQMERLGATADRITVIPGAVDADAVVADAAGMAPGFDALAGCRYVGMVGRLESVKGAETFLRAAAELALLHADVRFVIGGAGTQAGDLHALRTALAIEDRLVFPGKVPSAPATFAALDVVVVPSLSEGFGIVALEAGALGKPVVASAVGGLPEVIDNGRTGLLVPPADPSALAGAIAALLHDPARAAEMGAAARDRVTSEFTLERMTSAYLALYTRLLSA